MITHVFEETAKCGFPNSRMRKNFERLPLEENDTEAALNLVMLSADFASGVLLIELHNLI